MTLPKRCGLDEVRSFVSSFGWGMTNQKCCAFGWGAFRLDRLREGQDPPLQTPTQWVLLCRAGVYSRRKDGASEAAGPRPRPTVSNYVNMRMGRYRAVPKGLTKTDQLCTNCLSGHPDMKRIGIAQCTDTERYPGGVTKRRSLVHELSPGTAGNGEPRDR